MLRRESSWGEASKPGCNASMETVDLCTLRVSGREGTGPPCVTRRGVLTASLKKEKVGLMVPRAKVLCCLQPVAVEELPPKECTRLPQTVSSW